MGTKITATMVRSDPNTPWYVNSALSSENSNFQNVVNITNQLEADNIITLEISEPDSLTRIIVTIINDLTAYLAAFNAQGLPAFDIPEVSSYNLTNNITTNIVVEEIP